MIGYATGLFRKLAIVSIIMLLFTPMAGAVPTAPIVSAVSNNNATFSSTSTESQAWFEYGMTSSTLNVWTWNSTTVAGAYSWTEVGSPLTSGETYYVAACDQTGCSGTTSFTLLDATPVPSTTYGFIIQNASVNRFNVIMIISNVMTPYAWLFPTNAQALGISIATALILFAVFFGLAIRTRSVVIPIVVGLIGAPYFLYNNQGLMWGIPPEFTAVAQGITYACVAGILLVLLK